VLHLFAHGRVCQVIMIDDYSGTRAWAISPAIRPQGDVEGLLLRFPFRPRGARPARGG
jgi:hypothetical protein